MKAAALNGWCCGHRTCSQDQPGEASGGRQTRWLYYDSENYRVYLDETEPS